MAAIIGIALLGAVITSVMYVFALGIGRTPLPAWERDEAYKARPVDRYISVSAS